MSRSQHPIALRLERQVGPNRLLATVMALPLVDGIFPALVLAGFLDTVGGVVQVGLLVFAGSATVAVVLADLDEPGEHLPGILLIGIGITVVAAVEAALAPAIAGLLDLAVFERFAALVIAAVAAKTASARVGEYLPRPAVIIGLGLLASVDPSGALVRVPVEPGLVLRGAAAAAIAGGFALALAAFAPTLRGVVDIDRFRFGSAVALGLLPLSLLGLIPQNAPLAALAVTAVLAFDPGGDGIRAQTTAAADGGTDPAGAPEGAASADEERLPWF